MVKQLARGMLPASVWTGMSRVKNRIILVVRWTLEKAGFAVARADDYSSPLPLLADLQKTAAHWRRPSALRGVDVDLDGMKRRLAELLEAYREEIKQLPEHGGLLQIGFGPGYTAVDGITLYVMIRHFKPKRYIEVGSGLSTYYTSLAADKNAQEGQPVRITCIEPNPYPKLATIAGVEVVAKPVQNVDVGFFEQLEQNDVLFIDSSHVLKIGGDVAFLYLEVLPALKPGVVIHIHDVAFPYNIPFPPELWLFGFDWPLFWNEAMVLQAFLCFNKEFRILMSTPLLRHHDEAFLKGVMPRYESVEQNPNTFSAIWLQRRGAGAWPG